MLVLCSLLGGIIETAKGETRRFLFQARTKKAPKLSIDLFEILDLPSILKGSIYGQGKDE